MHKLITMLIVVALIVGGILYGLTSFITSEDTLKKADAIVAVSGGDTIARAMKAVTLYQQGYAPLVVFSGAAADPSSPSNARVMQELAIKSGVPSSVIRIDELSRDTKENAKGIKNILIGSKTVILVTSEYHQKRANKELQEVLPSVEIIDTPAEDKNWSSATWWLTPYGWWITVGEVAKNVL
jgi:uncharacterized SAM-binding protein YcdF (DUF218 family)